MDGLKSTNDQLTNHIHVCARCGLRYDWRKSPSSIKMTYCGSLCEKADLGFTLEALLKFKPAAGNDESEPVEAPLA
ncbi:MAG: hypothetical protein ACE5EF_02790 [Dehalococcoidia bacterium]